MTRPLIFGIAIATSFCIASLGLLLWFFDPATAGTLGLVLVLIAVALSLAGLLTIGFHYLHTRKRESSTAVLLLSSRQGAEVTAVVVGGFLLGYYQHLYWWYFPAGLLVVLLVEIYLRLRVE